MCVLLTAAGPVVLLRLIPASIRMCTVSVSILYVGVSQRLSWEAHLHHAFEWDRQTDAWERGRNRNTKKERRSQCRSAKNCSSTYGHLRQAPKTSQSSKEPVFKLYSRNKMFTAWYKKNSISTDHFPIHYNCNFYLTHLLKLCGLKVVHN